MRLGYFFSSVSLCVFSLSTLASGASDSADYTCNARLLARIQKYISQQGVEYVQQFPKRQVSALRGNEVAYLDVPKARNAHLLYIGSGGDLYRPLRDYPGVTHYHYLDPWTQWGDSALHVLFSLKHRLEFIASKVEILDSGFFQQMADNQDPHLLLKQSAKKWLKHYEQAIYPSDQPIHLRARITLPGAEHAPIVKHFYFHRFSYADSKDFDAVLSSIPAEQPVVGALQFGLRGSPFREDFLKILRRLDPQGYYLVEKTGGEYPKNRTERKDIIDEIKGYLAPEKIQAEFLPAFSYGAELAYRARVLKIRLRPVPQQRD